MIQRAGADCAIKTAFRADLTARRKGGQANRSVALAGPTRHGLTGALCLLLHAVIGFTNRSLRAHVAVLLGTDYISRQMTYDLRRLRRHGLIRRLGHSNTYVLTFDGVKVALFYTKLADRLLGPLLAVDHPSAPAELQQALRVVNRSVDGYIDHARMRPAA